MHRVLFNSIFSSISRRLYHHVALDDVVSDSQQLSDSSSSSSSSFRTAANGRSSVSSFHSATAVDLLVSPLLSTVTLTPFVSSATSAKSLSIEEKAFATFILSLTHSTPQRETGKTLVLCLIYRATSICPFCGACHMVPSTCFCGLPCNTDVGPTKHILCARNVPVPTDFHEMLQKTDVFLKLVKTYLVSHPTYASSTVLFLNELGAVPFLPSNLFLPSDLVPTVTLHFLSFATTFKHSAFVGKYGLFDYVSLRFSLFKTTLSQSIQEASSCSKLFVFFFFFFVSFFVFLLLTIIQQFRVPYVAASTQTFVVVSYTTLFSIFSITSCLLVAFFVAPRGRITYTQTNMRSYLLLAAFLFSNLLYAIFVFIVVRPFLFVTVLLLLSPVPLASALPLFPQTYVPSSYPDVPKFLYPLFLFLSLSFILVTHVPFRCRFQGCRLFSYMFFYFLLFLLFFFPFSLASLISFSFLLLFLLSWLSARYLGRSIQYLLSFCVASAYLPSVLAAPVTSFSVNLVIASVSFDLRDEELSPWLMALFFVLALFLCILQFIGYATLISALRRQR